MAAEVVDPIAVWLWTFAVHGTVIVALVAFVALFRRRDPAREEALWRYALVAGLLTATLQVSFIGAIWSPWALETSAVTASSRSLESWPEVARTSETEPLLAATPARADRSAGVDATLPTPDRWSWSLCGVVGALVLAACGLARLGLRRLALLRWLKGRVPVPAEHPMHRALDELRARCGMPRRVRLSSSPALGSPVAFGVLRAEICVPQRALDGLPPDWCGAMLAHELAHLSRRDPLWLDLAHTLRALFPWQPMLALAQRRLRTIAERRCDATAARIAGPVAVAECLVEVAGWLSGPPAPAMRGLSAMAVQRAGLRDRVERLLDDDWHERRALRPALTAATISFATALFSVALPGATCAESDESLSHAIAGAGEAVSEPDARSREFVRLFGLLSAYDVERSSLAAEVDALRARVRGTDVVAQRLLGAIDSRLAALDRLRREVVARAVRLFTPSIAAEPATEPMVAPATDPSAPISLR